MVTAFAILAMFFLCDLSKNNVACVTPPPLSSSSEATHADVARSVSKESNKLASLGATLVRNYDPLTHSLTDRGKV